jgi:hypothetical protein
MSDMEGYPILPHLSSEFLLWLWFHSERSGNVFNFTQPDEGAEVELGALAAVDLWVDERIAMRNPSDVKVSAVLTGENPSATLESRAALAGGKILQELRIGVRVDDREFYATLKGPEMMLHSVALPAVFSGAEGDAMEALVMDRMALLEEFDRILGLLYHEFARLRVSDDWRQLAGEMAEWIHGGV